ncbi:MAG: XrtA/PEP-CTERM system amidotransferase [Alphaproteobacteria bacterium]
MCGLVAIFDTTGRRAIDGATLARMTAALAHRGPDGEGFHVEPGLGLGHRRLAIVDVAGGAQPMASEGGDVVVVFNGEIYGHAALARRLRAAGHRFATRSDTEVILRAWEEWGEACVEQLDGMFAFVLWDRRRETLFAARDRLGEKPLHVARLEDGMVLLASELKALVAHPALGRALDPRAIAEFLAYGYVPDPRTILAGASRLEAGCTLSLRRGDRAWPGPRRYWRPRFRADAAIDAGTAVAGLREALGAAVRSRMVADVPVGAFLSGGIDSSAVSALMAEAATRPVETFSIGFAGAAEDESAHARRVAMHLGTRHRAEDAGGPSLAALDQVAGIHDEPFGDPSAVPTMQLCAAARRHVSVALSGDGGDEVFGGYRRHLWHVREEMARRLLPGRAGRAAVAALAAAWPKADWAPRPLRAKATLSELAMDPLDAYFHSVSAMPAAMRTTLCSPRLRRELDGHDPVEVLARHAGDAPRDDALSWAQHLDLATWLPGCILAKVDRASMAVGLEARAPFLDHGLVEWAGTLPRRLRLRGGEGKWILRQAMDGLLPPAILARRKQGFVMPLARWLRGPGGERPRAALLGGALADSGLLDMPAIARIVDAHRSGLCDHARPLWLLLCLEAFLRRREGSRLEEGAA